jgi:predicted nuclease of predicted toxin-antitoxin system
VKFLVDNQLPISLAKYLRKQGFDCVHVSEANLSEAADASLCRYAVAQERVIISKDEDFFFFAKQPEAKIQLIWVRLGNCRSSELIAALQRFWPEIEASLGTGDRIIEIR